MAKTTKGKTVTVLDAIERVLAAAGAPLHYVEITDRVQAEGLWTSDSKTPAMVINVQLSSDIVKRGDSSRFVRTGKGVYALRSEPVRRGPGRPRKHVSEDGAAVPAKPASKGANKVSKMSMADAAEHVLDRFAKRQPMHYKDITERALELGLIVTEGQSPAVSFFASMISNNKRAKQRGEAPRFEQEGNGYFGLTKWQEHGLVQQIQKQNDEVRKLLHARLHEMDPAQFESLVGRLLVELGFDEVVVTKRSGDGGIDVRGTLVVGDVIRTKMAVQVKRWKPNVQAPVVQQVRGSLGAHEQGLIITTSDFGPGATSEAKRPDAIPVGLMNGEQLVKLLIEHDLGVKRAAYDLIELGSFEEDS